MKNALDILQITLQTPGLNYAAIAALILLLWILLNTVRATIKLSFAVAREILPKITVFRSVLIVILTIFAVQNATNISDYIQYWETKGEAVAVTEYKQFSTSKTVAIFEAALRANTLPEEYNIITDSIEALRIEFGMDSLAAYQCMACECSMNPFIIRKDGVAAGIIQFTENGCKGLGFDLSAVKNWCEQRDAKRIMWATGQYLRSRANGKQVKTGLDFYMIVFAPGYLGKPPHQVLYNSGDAYRLNAGMDGFCIQDGIIVRHPSAVNGDITVNDVNLWMLYKSGQIIKKSLTFKN